MTRSSRHIRRRRQSTLDSVGSTSTPVHKQSWFVRLVAVVGLVGTLTGIAAGWFGIIRPLLNEPPKQFDQNTEIVIDRSTGMRDPFDNGSTKEKAAADAVATLLNVTPKSANLALREFGGTCDGKGAPLSIPFKSNNHGAIVEAVKTLKSQGEATLTYAVRDAVEDFSDLGRSIRGGRQL